MFRVARLLTALLAFTLLAANSASAITAVSAEKPASGSFGVFEHRVGIDALASAGRVDEKLALIYDFASDFPVAARGGGELTRVGRWMSKQEFNTMSATGRVVEGAGGRTYVIRPPNPASYSGARPGSVYAEFNVPSGVLRPGSKPDWAVIPGPNVTTRMYGPAPAEMPPATCIVCVIGGQ